MPEFTWPIAGLVNEYDSHLKVDVLDRFQEIAAQPIRAAGMFEHIGLNEPMTRADGRQGVAQRSERIAVDRRKGKTEIAGVSRAVTVGAWITGPIDSSEKHGGE